MDARRSGVAKLQRLGGQRRGGCYRAMGGRAVSCCPRDWQVVPDPKRGRRASSLGLPLFPVAGNPSGCRSRVLQRSKSLPHVMEFAQRRIELVPIRGICGFLLRIALGADAEVHDEQNGDDAKSDERGNDHGRAQWKGVLQGRRSLLFTVAAQRP